MAAQLNIKDAETVRRARSLAQARGEGVTQTIRTLIDQEWTRHEAEKRRSEDSLLQAVRDIQDEVRRVVPADTRGMTLKGIMDSIYDEGSPDGFAR